MHTKAQNTLVQVVPVGQGGVLDYTQCLKAQWDVRGQASHVIALSKELATGQSLTERIEACVGKQDSQACCVVLHFSGYGYSRRGVCFWLLDELQALRAAYRSSLRLTVVFHELFANGPPWRSAFWVSRLQEHIARRLAGLADAVWTNTHQHAGWLRNRIRMGVPLHVRPVFSNVGEPHDLPPQRDRVARAVVFGLPSTRQRVFDALHGHEAALTRLGVRELVEVGSGAASRGTPTSMPCRHLGRLERHELGEALQSSRFGLIDYPSQYLGKSGVFAAYAAHGCAVINTSPPGPDTDGLAGGRDYLPLRAAIDATGSTIAPDVHELIAANGRRWYAGHRLDLQATELWGLAGPQPQVDQALARRGQAYPARRHAN